MTLSVIARKLRMKPGTRALITNPPAGFLKWLDPLPSGVRVSSTPHGTYSFVQAFTTKLSDVTKFARTFKKQALPDALVWIAYPKKTSGIGSNLSRDVICAAMSETGWRPVSIVAIDDTWSALRFRPTAQVKTGRNGDPSRQSAS